MIETIIGFMGMAMILFAFYMSEIHKWNVNKVIYQLMNFVGSTFLVIYAFIIKSWPFLVLNLIWALVSFRDVLEDVEKDKKRKKARRKK